MTTVAAVDAEGEDESEFRRIDMFSGGSAVATGTDHDSGSDS